MIRRRVREVASRAWVAAALLSAGSAHAALVRVPADIGSLAVALAGGSDGDTVLVSPGAYTGTFVLPSGVTLRGDGPPGAVVLDAAGAGAALAVANGSVRTRAENLRLHGGHGHEDGGTRVGGALFVDGGTIALAGIDLTESDADLGGGACFVDAAVTWRGGTVRDNAAGAGGGVAVFGGTLELDGVNFFGNDAQSMGGALSLAGGAVAVVIGGTLTDNDAPDGGGMHVGAASLTISETRFERQHAVRGAGLFAAGGAYVAAGFCTWFDNRADEIAGAVYAGCEGAAGAACADVRLVHGDFIANHAAEAAAGAAAGASRITIESSVVAGNGSGFACTDPRAALAIACTAFGAVNDLPSSDVCTSTEGTTVVDPRLCDLEGGNLDRCANSPLLAPPACATPYFGARGGACAACGPTPVVGVTWGSVKARYR